MIKDYYINNYESFLKTNPKHFHLLLILSIFLITIIIYSNNIYINDVYTSIGYVNCDSNCLLKISIPIDKMINNIDYISIDNNKYNDYSLYYEDIKYDENKMIYYQNMLITTDSNMINNTLHEIKIFYNNETLFKKILSIIIN